MFKNDIEEIYKSYALIKDTAQAYNRNADIICESFNSGDISEYDLVYLEMLNKYNMMK